MIKTTLSLSEIKNIHIHTFRIGNSKKNILNVCFLFCFVLFLHDDREEAERGDWQPAARDTLGLESPRVHAASGGHLPALDRLVAGGGQEPLAARMHVDGVHGRLVSGEDNGERVGKGLEVARLRQLGYEVLRVDLDAHLALARTQVHVEAAVEALLDEVVVGRHHAQRRVLLGHKVDAPVLLLLALPLGQLGRVEQVLGRRIVRLGVVGQRTLGRRQVVHVLALVVLVVLGAPYVVEGRRPCVRVLLGLRSLHARLYPAHLDGVHVLANAQLLPLGGHEAALVLGPSAQRHLHLVLSEERGRVELVHLLRGVLGRDEALDDVDVVVGEHHLLARLSVDHRAPVVRVLHLAEELVELVVVVVVVVRTGAAGRSVAAC